ncbi:MAG: xanthine dehydrogenase family protein molybdopterin-binding subunit [Micromonosporaceae bacterium]|nr:xanthine dehydrogenase family protein molybdopterin-binding subunit [Micromonosporaceae bacterium]
MPILGTPVARVEDRRLVAGQGRYVDNLREPALAGAAEVVFVRSPLAHARIRGIDTGAARAAPGVLAVYTAGDLDLPPTEPAGLSHACAEMAQPDLATDVTRYAGEPVAAVVARNRYQAADAAAMVDVDYDPLPAVTTVEAGLAGATLLFTPTDSNLTHVAGDDDPAGDGDLFAGCEVVVHETVTNQRLAPVPMETRAAACAPDGAGGLVLWLSTQVPHLVRDQLTRRLGLVPGQLRVVAPDVGGGFGGKLAVDGEFAVMCSIARRLDRPVRWMETRSECMLGMTHGRGQRQRISIGGRRDGTILAYRLDSLVDAGAYPRGGAWMPTPTVWMACGAYDIPRVVARARSVLTTTTPTGAYRGAGRPEAAAAIERAVDLFAAEIGVDPAQVRLRNLLRPEAFPHQTPTGMTYDTGDYPAALSAVLRAADYPSLRAEQARRRAAGDTYQLGIGLSSYVEVTGLGGEEHGRLELSADGTVTGYVGTAAQGQGHETTLAMVVADRLGVAFERVTIRFGDTGALGQGGGTFGSRSAQLGGSVLYEATQRLHDEALPLAAAQLGVDEREVTLDRATGTWRVGDDSGRAIEWGELAARVHPDGAFAVEVKYAPAGLTYAFGAHLALVEVDLETGKPRLLRLVAVDDAGRILNPLLFDGQRHGGIAQGVGQALYEQMCYDSDGNPVTATLADYTVPSAADLPDLELESLQTATPHNPLGAKGIGEAGTIGSVPAVQNAVVDAVSHLGVRHIDMPLTPERVWQAIVSARPA